MKKGITNSLAYYLENSEGIDSTAARVAARKIADQWNDRNFWLSATLAPLVVATPRRSPPAREKLVRRLELKFNVHIHEAWEPFPELLAQLRESK